MSSFQALHNTQHLNTHSDQISEKYALKHSAYSSSGRESEFQTTFRQLCTFSLDRHLDVQICQMPLKLVYISPNYVTSPLYYHIVIQIPINIVFSLYYNHQTSHWPKERCGDTLTPAPAPAPPRQHLECDSLDPF